MKYLFSFILRCYVIIFILFIILLFLFIYLKCMPKYLIQYFVLWPQTAQLSFIHSSIFSIFYVFNYIYTKKNCNKYSQNHKINIKSSHFFRVFYVLFTTSSTLQVCYFYLVVNRCMLETIATGIRIKIIIAWKITKNILYFRCTYQKYIT